ncbi:MAG: barstar family protein [Desulfomonile tiedjei]|nr:barstar family protein [Desulfomonile tiedjei]
MKSLVSQHGLAFFFIDGLEIRSKDQFLEHVAGTLAFPEYFGHNWDALADCLTDMSWYGADGFVILYAAVDPFAEASREEFGTALEIFKESAEFWHDREKVMILLLSGSTEKVKGLPAIIV